MSGEFIANIIAFIALIVSGVSIYQSRATEKATNQREQQRDRNSKIFELEQKLDFILANRSEYIIRYKIVTFEKDLRVYCNLYGLNAEIVFRAFTKIYVPLTNDGKDVSLDLKELFDSASEFINLLK